MSSVQQSAQQTTPIVIGHRGASGYMPEHTLASYWLAIEQGADYVEPDLVATRDGVLVARHENAIAILDASGALKEATTDVHLRPEFASRRATKQIDGVAITGWFTEDFTLAELKTLRARERLPQLRPVNTCYDGMFEVPTFDEILQLVDHANVRRREQALRDGGALAVLDVKPIGVYPETKHPSYFRSIGLALEKPLVQALKRWGYRGVDAPVFIQSFEYGNLQDMRHMTDVPLILLFNSSGAPHDFVESGDERSYADLATPQGLAQVATFANGIGVATSLMIPVTEAGTLGQPTSLIADAHAAGLAVHGWTFRAENHFLPAELRSGSDPAAWGDLNAMIRTYLAAGMDGFFTDHPYLGRQSRDAFLAAQQG